jgi:hypothetical protein
MTADELQLAYAKIISKIKNIKPDPILSAEEVVIFSSATKKIVAELSEERESIIECSKKLNSLGVKL